MRTHAWIYEGDIYCPDCKPIPDPASVDGISGVSFSFELEADTPHHCATCHVFLENPLTDDGIEYVRECLGEGLTPVTQQWREYYGI